MSVSATVRQAYNDYYARLQRAQHAPRCQHIKVNGVRCGSPALRRASYCYFHQRLRRPRLRPSFPPLEDANAVQCAIMEVTRMLLDDQIEPKRAGLLLYALQTASINLKRLDLEPFPPDIVRSDPEAEESTAEPAETAEQPRRSE